MVFVFDVVINVVVIVYRFSAQPDHVVELSDSSLKFLTDLFKRYDKVSITVNDLNNGRHNLNKGHYNSQ